MLRRKFFQYSALSGASFLVHLNLFNYRSVDASLAVSMKKKVYDWIFLYWMPYDNDLSIFGNTILDLLAKGVQSDNILIVIQSKFSGAKRMLRHLIALGNIDIKELETADSSSEEVLAEYLTWAKSEFKAQKWAIVCLGHGGRLDEVSPDCHPIPGVTSDTKWMNIQKLSNVIENFKNEVDKRVELFFFQNCNKGTIEANYTFRDTAKYTLSSQLTLGAPNYYYEPMLKFVGRNPEINGGQLASKIMEFEPRDMYYSYTCVNNNAVPSLLAKINPLIESILSADIKAINLSKLKTYHYTNEQFVDVVCFFKTISKQSGSEQQRYNEFANCLNREVIYNCKKDGTGIDPDSRREYQNFSGLGMFLPKSKQDLEKYRYLQVYSDLKLVKLFDTILSN